MWIIIKFYNIFILSANMGGGERPIHKMLIKYIPFHIFEILELLVFFIDGIFCIFV